MFTAYNYEDFIEDALKGFLIKKTEYLFEVLTHDDTSAEWCQMKPEGVVISYGDERRQIFDGASNLSEASAPRYTWFKAGYPAGFIEAIGNLYTDIHAALSQYKETGQQESQEVFSATLATEGFRFWRQ